MRIFSTSFAFYFCRITFYLRSLDRSIQSINNFFLLTVLIAGSHEGHATRLRSREVPAALADESGGDPGDRGDAEAAGPAAADGPEFGCQRAGHAGYAGIIGVRRRWRVQSTNFGGDRHSSGLYLHRSHPVLLVGALEFLRELLLRLHLHEHYRLRWLRANGDYLESNIIQNEPNN